MNILYYSVHQILEDDEVRLFQRLGHNVLCLGSNGKSGSVQGFRPSIQFSAPEIELYEKFEACGGFFGYGQPVESIVIPASFMDFIDLVIVMHDPNFIRHFWNVICRKTVVWRTIGQDIEGVDRALRPYRNAGLRIVRYSPMESRFAESLGEDACIRFGKSADMYGKWNGSKKQILTFSNLYRKRYPLDYADYQSIVEGMPSALGGGGNESAPNAIGAVSSDEQIALLQLSCAYLYASGLYIPYTLNFIEAWLTGIPVVVYAPLNRQGIYFEIDRLVEHGVNGFVCRDVGEARRTLLQLLKSEDLRQRISAAGRQSAISYFDERVTQEEWARFLSRLDDFPPNSPITPSESRIDVKNMSKRIFKALSLLRPYDINLEKFRVGNERDGGYVLADISSTSDVISFGVGPDVSFELEMAERGHRIFMHDHTVEAPPQQHRRFNFRKKGIRGEIPNGDNLATLAQCLGSISDLSERLVLKMDVEGCEWDVFSSVMDETLERFDQIVLEVHWLENLSSPEYESAFSRSFQKINRQFTLFHVHANNCAEIYIIGGFAVASVLELSFVRTSLVRRRASQTVYPSALNKSNHPSYTDHPLLFYPFLPSSAEPQQIEEVITRIDLQHKLPD